MSDTPENSLEIQSKNDLSLDPGIGLPLNPVAFDDGIKVDAFSIRIILVIVFCTIFLVAVLVILIAFCLKRKLSVHSQRYSNSRIHNKFPLRDQEGTPRPVSNISGNSFMNENEDYLRGMNPHCSQIQSRPSQNNKISKLASDIRMQQPDIIEAEIHFVPSYQVYDYAYDHRIYNLPINNCPFKPSSPCFKSNVPDLTCLSVSHQEPIQREQSVLYREHQESKQNYFSHHPEEMHQPHVSPDDLSIVPALENADLTVNRIKNKNGHFLNTPLARLTPSTCSESPQHSIRILTLQDISRQQLSSAVLESTSSSGGLGLSKEMVPSNSDKSWNSPMGPKSFRPKWCSSLNEITPDIFVNRKPLFDPISEVNMKGIQVTLPNTPDDCISTSSESDEDSFTGSEYDEDENQSALLGLKQNQNSKSRFGDDRQGLALVHTNYESETDNFQSTGNGVSMMVTFEEPSTQESNVPTLQSLEYILNWGLHFESLMEVFQDIEMLPDCATITPSKSEILLSNSDIYV